MASALNQDAMTLLQRLIDTDSIQRLYGISDMEEIKCYLGADESQWPAISLAKHVDVMRPSPQVISMCVCVNRWGVVVIWNAAWVEPTYGVETIHARRRLRMLSIVVMNVLHTRACHVSATYATECVAKISMRKSTYGP